MTLRTIAAHAGIFLTALALSALGVPPIVALMGTLVIVGTTWIFVNTLTQVGEEK